MSPLWSMACGSVIVIQLVGKPSQDILVTQSISLQKQVLFHPHAGAPPCYGDKSSGIFLGSAGIRRLGYFGRGQRILLIKQGGLLIHHHTNPTG